MVKKYQDEIPPVTGRVYAIEPIPDGDLSRIIDATQYEQAGVEFKAADVCAACVLECNYAYANGNHALTHPNNGVENIKFHATHTYQSGEIFSLNGVTMTALTSDGMPIENGFFTADSIVYCIASNGVLYFTGRSRNLTDDADANSAYRIGFENGLPYVEDV